MALSVFWSDLRSSSWRCRLAVEEDSPEIEIRKTTTSQSAFVGRSRIRVSDIAQRYELIQQQSIAELIQDTLPSLSVEQINAALEYWRTHEKEIQAEIEAD